MVATGLTPSPAITAATKNSAQVLPPRRPRDDCERQGRKFYRSRRKPAGEHHEFAKDLARVSARPGSGTREAADRLDGPKLAVTNENVRQPDTYRSVRLSDCPDCENS